MMMKPREKQRMVMKSKCARGIAEWLAESASNRWQSAAVAYFGVGENTRKRDGSFIA
jgi:hypothetical protein